MNDNLKPCPFCGFKANIDYDALNKPTRYAICCCWCGVQTQHLVDKEEIIKMWNRRHKESELNE